MHNKITINENSVITLKEASEILDSLFKCGKEIPCKARDWTTGKEIDAYIDGTIEERADKIIEVLAGTPYNNKREFEKDFFKWLNLGWQIQDIENLRIVVADAPSIVGEKRNERKSLWERLSTVFIKEDKNKATEQEENGISPIPQQPTFKRKKRGSPKRTFDSILVKDKEITKKKLHSLIEGKEDSKAVIYIKAAIQMGIIQKPTYTQFEDEFGKIASKSTFNKYLRENKYSDDELQGAKQALKNE